MADRDQEKYLKPIGYWQVTTDGDCEGKSQRHLGTWYGNWADIAFHLADQQFYNLKFEKVERDDDYPPTKAEVNIMFSIDSGTWDMGREKRIEFFTKALGPMKDKVHVKECNYYGSVTLTRGDVAEKELRKNKLRKQALGKLTEDEKEALDLD